MRRIDGVDITPEMLSRARLRGAHDTLHLADLAATPLPSASYQLVTLVLADEHLAELGPFIARRPGCCSRVMLSC